jgi:predicted NUDIX family phosphoesterase
MAHISTVQQQQQCMHDEYVLVVKREYLFGSQQAWHGLRYENIDDYLQIIDQHKEFHPRSIMESDAAYKQIIPYLVFTHDHNYFLMKRKADASETRLRNKLTLGIGGHIRQEDMQGGSIIDWAMREFHEEVEYVDNLKTHFIGIINDDTNDVGKVHIGLAVLMVGDSPDIRIKSELQSGELVMYDDCLALQEDMETWSQFVVDYLQEIRK